MTSTRRRNTSTSSRLLVSQRRRRSPHPGSEAPMRVGGSHVRSCFLSGWLTPRHTSPPNGPSSPLVLPNLPPICICEFVDFIHSIQYRVSLLIQFVQSSTACLLLYSPPMVPPILTCPLIFNSMLVQLWSSNTLVLSAHNVVVQQCFQLQGFVLLTI
jgi:hypothetical protein